MFWPLNGLAVFRIMPPGNSADIETVFYHSYKSHSLFGRLKQTMMFSEIVEEIPVVNLTVGEIQIWIK